MSDHLIWKNDITNRFSPTSLTDATDGDGFIATAIISSVTIVGAWQMSLWDAYKDLRDKLLNGEDGFLPETTTTQRDALSSLVPGMLLLNVTTMRGEFYTGSAWISVAGSGRSSPVAYASMWEDSIGSAHNTTTKAWITAGVGVVDGNGIVTFSDNAAGDRLVIGTGGAGDYLIAFHASVINAGGNVTYAAININTVEQSSLKSEHAGDSSEARMLAASGILTLAAADYITLELTSSTSSDVISIRKCSLTVERIS